MKRIFLTVTFTLLMVAPTLSFAQRGEKGRWGEGGRRTVRCESQSKDYAYCRTYTTGRVELREQLSKSPCREYESWGSESDGSGVWVRGGCRAVFAVRERHWGWGDNDSGSDWDGGERTFKCKSENFAYNHCPVPGGRGRKIKLVNQTSDSSCVRGSSWGEDRYGVWVDHGCAGEFQARR